MAEIADIYRYAKKPCRSCWRTREGRTLRVNEMTADHLLNCVLWVLKRYEALKWRHVSEGYGVLATLNGEMAQDACSRELEALEETSAFDFAMRRSKMFPRLLAETVRRKIDYLVRIPEWLVLRRDTSPRSTGVPVRTIQQIHSMREQGFDTRDIMSATGLPAVRIEAVLSRRPEQWLASRLSRKPAKQSRAQGSRRASRTTGGSSASAVSTSPRPRRADRNSPKAARRPRSSTRKTR